MKCCIIERQAIEDWREFDVVVAIVAAGIPCGDSVEVGDIYVGGGFQPRAGVLLAATLPPAEAAPE